MPVYVFAKKTSKSDVKLNSAVIRRKKRYNKLQIIEEAQITLTAPCEC